MTDRERKTYLGDGLYATDLGHCIRLTSEDGINILAAVYLEDDMIRKLCNFAGVLLHGD